LHLYAEPHTTVLILLIAYVTAHDLQQRLILSFLLTAHRGFSTTFLLSRGYSEARGWLAVELLSGVGDGGAEVVPKARGT